jgi:hypothetical protein
MHQPTAAFRLSRSAKALLSNISCPHLRGITRRSLIDAEIASQIKPRRERTAASPSDRSDTNTDG